VTRANPWRVVCASAIGSDHVLAGLPNQDHALVQQVDDRLVIVVSDGAGSAMYAAIGARLACENALALLTTVSGPEVDVRDALVTGIQAAVRAEAEARTATMRDFACTLLGVVVAPDWSLFLQVGDGAIVVTTAAGYEWIFWPEKGEHFNETAFVTQRDAADHLEVAWRLAVDEVVVFTDGLERLALDFDKRVAHPAFFAPMIGALHAGADAAELEAFLASPRVSERTSDDKTLVLASRR